ncbi:MAG: SMP-30/Gluconolaconase/LRE-like region [Verrucomicrobiales bacterium]|nr:SMP-30/Gluconolaconase/LRE-like region [Verrucomicrobiales bacterium]
MKASFFQPLVYLFSVLAGIAAAAEPVVPEVRVPGWELTLFASEPEIVTPVGIAVDKAGRVFVTESHTHLVKPEYQGPKTDCIVILEDTNGDGKADRRRIFAEGFMAAMNLRFDPDGVLHMVHRNGVVRLEDADRDGVCEKQVTLLTLDTKAVYPHNGLSSLVFAPDGYLYIGSGENFGESCIATAADGSSFSWTPGGANILRMRQDGSKLERWATGLWNCFALTVDGAGRLLAADNDPDSRSPCRLLHIVEGGDYGFRFQYGRSGLHPFVSWNGELPGTLPMIGSTGEAPASILDAGLTVLGPDRGDGFLVSEWGDNALSWYRLQPRGASFGASREEVIKGQAEFRPSCLAAAPDGSVYLTDWADREYPVHGKGRIWHLKAKSADQTPQGYRVLPVTEPEQRRARLAGLMEPSAWPELKTALTDADPWIADAVRTALSRPVFQQRLLAETESTDPALRLGVLLVLHRTGYAETEPLLRRGLVDRDAAVRRLAMRWAAELRLNPLRPLVEKALDVARENGQPVTQEDFSLWLAALDLISRDAPPTAATALVSNDDLLQRLLADPAVTPAIKAATLPRLTNFKAPATIRTLIKLSAEGDPRVREEAVRSLGFATVKAVVAPLQRMALDGNSPVPLRLNALGSLAGRDDAAVLPLLPLLGGENTELGLETARALRTHVSHPKVRASYTSIAAQSGTPEGLKAQAALALGVPPPSGRPRSDAEWTAVLLDAAAPADADRGRRVFLSPVAQCSTCHAAEGCGIPVGPDLSIIARSSSREKLIQSILEPTRETSPLYVTKTVTLRNGTTLSGVPSSISSAGSLTLLQAGGATQKIPQGEVAKVEDTAVSLMPEALEANLTVQDFRDLLAYLLTLK